MTYEFMLYLKNEKNNTFKMSIFKLTVPTNTIYYKLLI